MQEQHFASTRRDLLKGLGFTALAAGLPARLSAAPEGPPPPPSFPPEDLLPRPTPQQLAWQEGELTMFLHFGVNTFTNREWGEGKEEPQVFNPAALDARQWVQVAKEAGFRYVILTCKHHDGFCLWPSRYTEHSVKHSPWRDGKGDVVRELSEACREAGMKMGVYLSPWDRNHPAYGDSPRYNEYFRNQLTELLSNYGEIAEVWFDGACGEGPNGKRQQYDFPSYYEVVRRLQPRAVIAICGPDVRWVGNEDGFARETEWSIQPAPAGSLAAVNGKAWYPAECDVSIRPGWFWHQAEDAKVKTLDHLLDIYFRSVGRNSVLLLNVPPNDQGLVADPDRQRLREFRQALNTIFADDLARRRPSTASSTAPASRADFATDSNAATSWSPRADDTAPSLEIDLGGPRSFNICLLQEEISQSQRVESYRLDAWDGQGWREIVTGTTIGHKKLDRFAPVTAARVRLSVLKSLAPPLIRAVGLYHAPSVQPSKAR